MKKRSLASLLIVSIVAVAAVFGVVFAFKNSGRQQDVYGSVTVTVDKPEINLEIELVKDETTDNGFRIVDKPESSAYFTIKVDGLPKTASRRVELNKSSISNGTVKVESVSSLEEAARTGINSFKVTGINGGAPVKMVFTTVSGAQTIAVTVNVHMTAKDMKIAEESRFALRQGEAPLNLMSNAVLNKFTFFAHPEDSGRVYTANKFPVTYRLKEEYPGVILQQGAIAVSDAATCVDQYIILQAKLPAMTEWLDIPFYVFPAAKDINIKTADAYKSETTQEYVWDLIKNRSKYANASFEFALDYGKSANSDYGFKVVSADKSVASVEYIDQYTRKLSAGQNLGEVAIDVVCYPIINVDGKPIAFDGAENENVQIKKTFYIRVRNEFNAAGENFGSLSYALIANKNTVNTYYYEGKDSQSDYFDTFTLNTENRKIVNFESEIEFILDVEYPNGQKASYGWDASKNPNPEIGLFNVLQIGYWSSETNSWVMLSEKNHTVNYLNTFRISFVKSAYAQEEFMYDDLKLTLRAESVHQLTNGAYASYAINLDSIYAIDGFDVKNLTEFDDGSKGIALVYDEENGFSSATLEVCGLITGVSGVVDTYSKNWNPNKVTDNRNELQGFKIESSVDLSGDIPYSRYEISGSDKAKIEYYKDYPLTLVYANGKSLTVNVRIYPTVEKLSMLAVSNNRGEIYKTNQFNNGDFDVVRTAYVRKGHTYEFTIDTANVNVGAYAMFDEVRRSSGDIITNTTSKVFDARELDEGIYECQVSLHAYSDSVYAKKKTKLTVYMVVVDPVVNVAMPEVIRLNGINDSAELTISLSTIEGTKITDDKFLKIDVVEPINNSILVETGAEINKFKVTAKYISREAINLGFKIFKSYNFVNYDLDGDGRDGNEIFELNYIGGNSVTTQVVVVNEAPNKIEKIDGVNHDSKLGNYLGIITKPESEEKTLMIDVADQAKNNVIGIAYAEWKNGKYELSPFVAFENDLIIPNVVTINLDHNEIKLTPVNGVTSLGNYALVVYTCDSLYLAEVVDGEELVLPQVYEFVSLYLGSEDEVNDKIKEIASGVVHDANSGQRNDRGGYNWVLQAKNSDNTAALFYTPEGVTNNSEIEANVYYFDDLYTVLNWEILNKPQVVEISKLVNGETVSTDTYRYENDRLSINLNNFVSDTLNDTICLKISASARTAYFYIVNAIDVFELKIVPMVENGENSTEFGVGLASRKNLSPDENNNLIDTVPVQRGKGFDFKSDLPKGWSLYSSNFTQEEQRKTSDVSYSGGVYTFFPKISLGNCNFELDALKSTVKVNVRGGIKYLNITDSFTLDSLTAATYDLTVRTDELLTTDSDWTNGVLDFTFLYQDVYNKIFDDEAVSYINMEGGKAQLEFKLTYLGASEPVNGYYTYWLKITVAIVVKVPDVDPFYEFSGARLYVTEDLTGSALVKTPMSDSAELNLIKDGVSNITLSHFAETNAVAANKNAVSLTDGQTNSGIIYLDENSLGGILVVHPTPNFANVTNIVLSTKKAYEQEVVLGYDLSGKPIKDKVKYSIGFTQMVYNEDQKFYQPYISGSSIPKMISTWSSADGYKWDGKYYFKTFVVCDSNTSQRLDDGAEFTVEVTIKGENNTDKISEEMSLVAKYKNSFVITPDDDVEDYAVCTMQQTQYQALGTTAIYDIALPLDCIPNYAGFTFNGISSASKTVETSQAIVTLDSVAQTISVYLKADSKNINQVLEVRIPYKRQGDYVNPYLSVVIVPVYFEFESLEVIDHYESRLQLKYGEVNKLKYKGLFKYDTSMLNSILSEKIKAFNYNLQTSSLIYFDYETPNEISVEFCYNYENGVPVLAKNGICRYVQVFEYDVVSENVVTDKRTEYLAVGTAKTFTFENWDSLYANKLYKKVDGDYEAISDYLEIIEPVVVRNNVEITVSLINKSKKTNSEAYAALINQKEIVINVFSTANTNIPLLELTIVPVYFTLNEFKLQNNPVNPIVALTKPVTVTVQASGIEAANDAEISNKINAFNADLLSLQNNLADTNTLTFSPVANDNGFLNFNFDSSTREITRADTQNPTSAISYLLVSTSIKYVNGLPTIVSNGKKISTYFTVRTFGEDSEEENEEELELAPEGRARTVAQAIGTTVRYNVSLPGVVYDSLLVQSEVDANNRIIETSEYNWKAHFDLKDGVITVVLNKDTELFNKTLRVMAYSRSGRLVYVLNIIPAYFTVEQVLLANHLGEDPILVKSGTVNWVENLELDFASNYDKYLENFDFKSAIDNFRDSLKDSSMVSRIENKNSVLISAGINYINGIPTLVNWYNAKIKLQNSYSYLIYDGVPEITKVQFLGQTTTYNINRKFESIKIFDEGVNKWMDLDVDDPYWTIIKSDEKSIKVVLTDDSSSVIGKINRVGIFENYNDADPIYVLNIIPAYFVVEDITVKGQTIEDRYVELYFGEAVDSPAKLVFDTIIDEAYSRKAEYNIPSLVNNFKNEFQNTKANLIGRYYDSDATAGDLLVTLYLNYKNGYPVLVDASESGNDFVVRLDANFTYKIYKKGDGNNDFPLMPAGPRTRTEVQAVGTTSNYVIDLDKELLLDDSNLPDGVLVSLSNNVLTVELSEAADTLLKQTDIEINLYAESVLVFVLEIQPVLYEVVGVKTNNLAQPIYLPILDLDVANLSYCAIAKYNNEVTYEGKNVQYYIEQFNGTLNSDLVVVELNDKYLKINLAVDYGTSGSKLRSIPALLNVNKYPLNVIESYVEFTDSPLEQGTTSAYYQAVGTTEVYYLGGSNFENAQITNIDSSSVTANIKHNSNSYILEVNVAADANLVGDSVAIKVMAGDKEYTLNINLVWFVVEGFEVVNHPERHMWLINMNEADEIDNLLFHVRSRHAIAGNDAFKAQLQEQISLFNQKLTNEWTQKIERYTIGSSYLVVRAAVDYDDGVGSLINIDDAKATQFVRDVFEYVIYSDANHDIGEIRPVPAHPSVMGSSQVRQVIGTKKNYSINVNGEVSYKYLWVENAGDLKNTYNDSNTGLLHIEYEDLIVYVDNKNDKIQVELAANYSEILSKNIRIYVPYLASYSKGIWYSHCIEITPVLFELEGWTIAAKESSLDDLITDKNNSDYLLLTSGNAEFNYVAKIKKGEITNNILIDLFEQSKADLERNAVSNVEATVEQGNNISFDGLRLSTNFPDVALENIVGLSCYVTYEKGIPVFDKNKFTVNEIYNQISISTGYTVEEWEEIEKGLLANGVAYATQAIGTVKSNILEIPNAAKIFTKDIKVVNRFTKEPIKIPGERENLISVKCENFDKITKSVVIKVALAPVEALRYENIEILIPFAKEADAEKAKYVFSYRITPALYIVNGVYLAAAENNFVELKDKDVQLELKINIDACYDYNLKSNIAFRSQNLEADINDAINNSTLNFVISDGIDDDNINVAIKSHNGLRWISRINNIEVLNYIKASLNINYQDGLPQLSNNNSIATNSVPLEIQVQTKMVESSDDDLIFPDPDPKPDPNPEPTPNPGDDDEDIYKKPIPLGRVEITQLIGSTNEYTLSDINGTVAYQYLWVSNAGSVVAPFENASMEMTKINEFLSISVDPVNNTLSVKLEPNSTYLLEPIDIYVPYVDDIDGEDIWYSYCVHITPALFKLNGWKIQGIGENADSLINQDEHYLLTAKEVDIKYVADIEHCIQDNQSTLLNKINNEKIKLEMDAAEYMHANTINSTNIVISNTILTCNDLSVSDLYHISLVTYLVYENGIPKLVQNSKQIAYSEITISTNFTPDEWKDIIRGEQLRTNVVYGVQAVGTSKVYDVKIDEAFIISANEIEVLNADTQKPISANWVTVDYTMTDLNNELKLRVNLEADASLFDTTVEIKIPYVKNEEALYPNYFVSYYITPVAFVVDGFYLSTNASNNIDVTEYEVALDLRVKANYTSSAELYNGTIKVLIENFEKEINDEISQIAGVLSIKELSGDRNIQLVQSSGKVLIKKLNNKSAINTLSGEIIVGYEAGMAHLYSVNSLTDALISLNIQVTTREKSSEDPIEPDPTPDPDPIDPEDPTEPKDPTDPDKKEYKVGQISKSMQSIGTSRDYKISFANEENLTFYLDRLEVKNGGPKRGENEYENFDIQVKEGANKQITVSFTLMATAKTVNNWIDIYIPYTANKDGVVNDWFVYILRVKPVLFEVTGWALKVGDEIVNDVVLNRDAVELYFTPQIIRCENDACYYYEELEYIKNSIKRLEMEINTYDPTKNDKYTYMVIENTPEVGSQVNYDIVRDDDTNTSYLVRTSNDVSTTVMNLSVNIAYGISDFDKSYVGSAQAVEHYDETTDTIKIWGQVSVRTMDRSIFEDSTEELLIPITQETAAQLMNLQSGFDYILMSDIYLEKIPGLIDGKWKPVSFPNDATLDGNNFKIYFGDAGFDLSSKTPNIGLFTQIPEGSVVKNVQIVIERGTVNDPYSTLTVNLQDYGSGSVNIGLLAGVNNGIVTNCAVLSEWQFEMRNLTEVINPVTETYFEDVLPFNKDGIVFDENYFYELGMTIWGEVVVTNVYNNLGYRVEKNYETGKYDKVLYDVYHNVANWIEPDRTNVACYDDYTTIELDPNSSKTHLSKSLAKFYVQVNNRELDVTLGGLVGVNAYMVTNSRVLVDVELYGPEVISETGLVDEKNVASSIVGGFVGVNDGTITSSFFRDGSVINNANAANEAKGSLLGGFVGQNNGNIMQSYAMGCSTNRDEKLNNISAAGIVKTVRNSLGGFVHVNSGHISDCLVNMVIEKTGPNGSAGGFVYRNKAGATITNCVENNNVIVVGTGLTTKYYAPFIQVNGDGEVDKNFENVDKTGLNNLIYAGNVSPTTVWGDTIKHLTNNNADKAFNDIKNYSGFSIGYGELNVTDKNTIWKMTGLGPMLRAANEIAVSSRKYSYDASMYLYKPGSAKNPYLVWNEDQFDEYVYKATAHAVQSDKDTEEKGVSDIERNRQNNHLRLVDNFELTKGIQGSQKIIYTGTLEGNGLTMSGINSTTNVNRLATMGLFGKTEYATIRNINLKVGSIISEARYVGAIAGIAINTNFVDVNVLSESNSGLVSGKNIVGGFVGLNIINDPFVENYNIHSSLSVEATFGTAEDFDENTNLFTSGEEYVRQTLYSQVSALDQTKDQGFSTAGSVFGFVTSNPNNYRVVDENGNETIIERRFDKTLISDKGIIRDEAYRSANNSEKGWFSKDKFGNSFDDSNLYYSEQIALYNVSGEPTSVTASVAGGLIGIIDETIEINKPSLENLKSLTGKYYLGGIAGINLGKISGGISTNKENKTTTYSTANLNNLTISSSAKKYVFSNAEITGDITHYWGMTVGGIAGYNNGVIENINIKAKMLGTNSDAVYVLGGVVGVNSEDGYLVNVVNNHNDIQGQATHKTVQVDNTQAGKIGYYFGKVVGRGASSDLIMIPFNSFPNSSISSFNRFVNKDKFVPNEYFNVVANETNKVQTMTIEEYRAYLVNIINTQPNLSIIERINLLEPWLHSLPTEVITIPANTIQSGDVVFAEVYESNAKEEFLNWVKTNNIFEIWTDGYDGLKNNVIYDYGDYYLAYRAISTELAHTAESETDFVNNIETYRDNRHQMATEFFTYKYNISSANKISGTQNLKFKWWDYEEYLILKEYSRDYQVLSTSSEYELFEDRFGTELTQMVYPYATMVEYTDGRKVMTYSNEHLRKLLALTQEEGWQAQYQFTNKDPLQVYINYVVQLEPNESVLKIDNFEMPLVHYYYYMSELYGKNYTSTHGSYSYNYSIPTDLPIVNSNGYASYLYLNFLLDESGTNMLTIPEYIDAVKHEMPIVRENEEIWLKTGHQAGGARISDVGVEKLGWADRNHIASVVKEITVNEDRSIFTYGDNSWNVDVEYDKAKGYGLDINKYKEIITLGGSLYEFINKYENGVVDSVDKYIFGLKTQQFGWTDKQVNFIEEYYKSSKNNNYDLKYAIVATTYGNILDADGVIRSVYKSSNQTVDEENGWWYVDNDLNGNPSEGEPKGVWYFPANQGAQFVNGDGSAYYVNTSAQINLAATGNQGAAMYIDGDGNKIFGRAGIASGEGSDSREAGKDVLLMYQVENGEDAEFYQVDTNSNSKTYFKIIRQIVQNESVNITSGVEEDPSGNKSDFLEEALWWRNQGFTAYEFAEIKTHAMTKSLPDGSSPAAFEYATEYTVRNTGYTLADDWHNNETASSFKSAGFTPSDYTAIVLGASYKDGKWYSIYADYLLFTKLNDVGYMNDVSVDPDAITDMLPLTSEFNDPFGYDHKGNHLSEMFIAKVAHETELSDAMVFSSDRVAFMQMFQLGCSSADYIAWAEEFAYNVDQTEEKYFRINHYIYYIQEDLVSDSNFETDDLKWVLTPEVTKEIFYTTVTPEARTTDLVEYRRNWFNKGGKPYITFRDYCEWINIYKYSDKYRMDRGDIGMENEEIDQGDLTATDGWLSLESFAVWKRMEKYENNVEYLKNITDTTPEYEITAPILKRQISTTVFPRLDSSGEYKKDESGLTSYERRYLPQATTDSSKIDDVNDDIIKYYGWDKTNNGEYIFKDNLMSLEAQRHVNDRYEYNEYYIIRSDLERTLGNDEELDSKEDFYQQAYKQIIHDTKYAKDCDILCGGLVNPCACQDHTHAAYHVRRWEERYGLAYYEGKLDYYNEEKGKQVYKGDAMYALKLDEFKIKKYYLGYITEEVVTGFDQYGNASHRTEYHYQYCIIPDDRSYAQLYVPYDVFKWACQTIKSQFPDSAGYKNYMKFWARNGAYNWICDTSEYDGPMDDEFVKVQYTYRAHNFWTNYDGTLSPVDGSFMKAVGWE